MSGKRGNDCGETGRHIEIDHSVIQFPHRRHVLVPQAKIECEIAANTPIVLDEQIPGGPPEIIFATAVLNGRELGQPKEKIGEIVTGTFDRRQSLIYRCGTRAGKCETPARVLIGLEIRLDPTKVSSPTQGMAPTAPNESVLDLYGPVTAC